jgi:hypothetical protein
VIIPSGKNNIGVSGRPIEHNIHQLKEDTIANELALLMLGDFEPLGIKIDTEQYKQEMKEFQSDWVSYLPRDDRSNNRYGLSFFNLPGYGHRDVPSLAEVRLKENRKVSELEMNHPTILYEKILSLRPLFNLFEDLGRTFVVRCDKGGYFVPHRDHPQIVRDSFRVICFLNNVGPYDYDWLMDERKVPIELGRCYYVNTRKVHRTISWKDNSQHLILNVPMNTWNVATVIGNMLHGH